MLKLLKYSLWFLLALAALFLLLSWSGAADMVGNPRKVNKKRAALGMPAVQSMQQKVGERTLFTIYCGDTASTTALLFLHGSPGSWDASSIYLNDRRLQKYLLLAPDRPGYGESDLGVSLPSLQAQAIMIHKLMDHWPGKQFLLIGHSYGCSLAQQLAFDYPDQVAAVVHVAPPLDPELEFGIGWRRFFNQWIFQVLTPEAFLVCNQELITLKADLELLLPRWPSLRVPVYLIQGMKDNLVSPKELDFFQKVAPLEFQHLYPHPGSHFIYWSEKEFVIDVIRSALKAVNSQEE